MILCFSGTGNSRFIAERLALALDDELLSLNARIKSNDFSEIKADKPLVICTPTYAWQIPHIVERHLKEASIIGNKSAYFVMTCGDDNGNAASYIKAFCKEMKLDFMGCISIVMPENYIAMFSSPSDGEAQKIIDKALPMIDTVSQAIKQGAALPNKAVSTTDRLKSGIVNKAFYSLCIKASKFYTTSKCVSCGKCVEACPLNNIELKNGKPIWGKSCTHCMACICRCPTEAIEYSTKSHGQNRYVCKFDNKSY